MFQSARGMQDALPTITPYWQVLEAYLRELVDSYAYQEIRLPIIEKTALFQHSIGLITDIIDKEMYHLVGGTQEKSLSLRPEGTAGCVRAAIEHRLLLSNLPQRLWYLGPMFRHERPQKGRYRQFHQFGVEVLGILQPEIDAELIAMTQRLWEKLTIQHRVRLEINSLGNTESREQYRNELVNYFTQRFDELDEDSKRRLHTNPLRILDSKQATQVAINQEAPKLLDYLDQSALLHFESLQRLLQTLGIPFSINTNLVRGLDYYNNTVFEWVIEDEASAQNTLCGGGRYDNLVRQLGGPDKSAIGFAIGLERLLEVWMTSEASSSVQLQPLVYIIQSGSLLKEEGLQLAEKLRHHFPHLRIEMDCMGGNFREQFKRANARGASTGLVLGDREIETQTVTLKDLHVQKPQLQLTWPQLLAYLQQAYGNKEVAVSCSS